MMPISRFSSRAVLDWDLVTVGMINSTSLRWFELCDSMLSCWKQWSEYEFTVLMKACTWSATILRCAVMSKWVGAEVCVWGQCGTMVRGGFDIFILNLIVHVTRWSFGMSGPDISYFKCLLTTCKDKRSLSLIFGPLWQSSHTPLFFSFTVISPALLSDYSLDVSTSISNYDTQILRTIFSPVQTWKNKNCISENILSAAFSIIFTKQSLWLFGDL